MFANISEEIRQIFYIKIFQNFKCLLHFRSMNHKLYVFALYVTFIVCFVDKVLFHKQMNSTERAT